MQFAFIPRVCNGHLIIIKTWDKCLSSKCNSISHIAITRSRWSMNPDNMSCYNSHSNFVFKSIALELMGHTIFREFHLNWHVSAIKCDWCLFATVPQFPNINCATLSVKNTEQGFVWGLRTWHNKENKVIRSAKKDDNYGASNIVLPCPSS